MEHKLNTNKLKSNILKSIAMIFVALLGVIIYIILYTQDKNFKFNNEKVHKSIHKSIKHTLEHNKRYYKFLLQRLSQTTNIKQYIINNDADAIYKILKPKFDLLQKENKYFKILHIIKPDGTSLLRVHKKEQFIDNLSSIPPMIKEAITSKKITAGYGTGKCSTAYRVILPLFYENRYIGSICIGVNPNYFLEKISEIIDTKGILFINNKNLKLYSKKSDFSIQNYNLQTTIDDEQLNVLKHLPKKYNFEDNIRVEIKDKKYIMHTENIKGFRGDDYAKYIFIQDGTNLLKKQNIMKVSIVSSILLFATIVFLVLIFYINKFGKDIDKFYNNAIDKIKFNKEYLKAVEDNSSNIIVTSFGRKLFSANKKFFEFTGFDTLESFGKKYDCICDLFIKKEGYLQTRVDGKYWIVYILENPAKIHKAIMIKDGVEHIYSVTSAKLYLDEHDRCVATFVDITELENIKDRYEFAINGTQDGLWDWNIITNKPYFSPRWKSMLGYRDDELKNEFKTWEDMVHPDDIKQVFEDIQRSHKSKDEVYENIHRLKHKDGHWVWILARGETIFDENGKAVRMVGFHTDITKSKELELKLEENQKMYLDFFECTKSANIIYETKDNGKTFIIKSLNHLVEEFEKIKRDEVVGKRLDEVFKGVEEFGFLDIFKEVYKSGKSFKMPVTFYKDERVSVWRENYIFKLSNGDIVASYEDKTKEKELENKLIKIFESMIDGVYVVNSSFDIEYVNEVLKKDFGSPEGKKCYKYFHDRDEVCPWCKNEQVLAGETVRWEWFSNKNNKLYDLIDTPLVNADGTISKLEIFRDITELKQAYQEIHEQEEIMISQSRHAAMGEMISMIAHQWRQPLSVIAMGANNIMADIELEIVDNKTLQEEAAEILEQTQELSKTIDDFKNFFRPVKTVEEVLPEDIFNEAFKVIGKSLGNNDIEVVTQFNNGKKIQTYSRELMQVFINIIKNAKEALVDNDIKNRKIFIKMEDKLDTISIKICDNGTGISKDIIDKIYDPYFTTKDKENGTGLGLYMSKTIIEKHLQGTLKVSNKDASCFQENCTGACFEIQLPYDIKPGETE
ncbi:MAG: PAS domain-containing protein [Arcobacteraceae bacterium]|nr:PAS domain-containing protein [Arcobacteraceae bacterium]